MSAKFNRCSVIVLIMTALTLGCTQGEQKSAAENGQGESIAQAPTYPKEVPQYDAATFFETVSYFGSSFSHDGSKLLITSDKSEIFNVYAIPFEGGEMEQLTNSTDNAMFSRGWFPNDNRILYTFDEGGNELNHVYVREEDGSVRDLTPGDNVKANMMGWNRDAGHFFISTNERDPKFFDLYRYNADGYEREMFFENKQSWNIQDISYDGRWLAISKIRNNMDSDIYLWDSRQPDKEPWLITEHEGNVNHSAITFTPDNKELYYATNEFGEFYQAWSYNLETSEKKKVLEADWNVSFIYFSRNGKYRVSGINADARTKVTIVETATGKEISLPDSLPAGSLSGVNFSADESRMAFYLNSDTSPSNLYVYDLNSGEYRQLTTALNPAMKEEHLVSSEVIRYKSFDGLEIPSLLYRPWQSSADNPVPALVWVHGGPGGQSRAGYRAAIQHLVNHGYAVLAVNNRGSSGYGKTFFHMDDRKHGDVDLKDCVQAKTYLAGLDWVDGDQIGIIGGSYGGYMVAAALAFEPDVFDVGVNIFGVTNWLRTLESIPPWWEDFKESLYSEMGDPAEDRDRLHAISPLFHAQNIVKPLLVVQGANDPRVLQVESDELVEAVRKNGVPVEYVLFDDEGHGFRKRENRITASNKYVSFLDEHLKGKKAEEGDSF